MNKVFMVFGTLAISTLCCYVPYSPFANILTVEKPDTLEIAGVYQMTGQNLNETEPFENRKPEISINEDGTCSVTDFPIWKQYSATEYSVSQWLSFDGLWKVGESGNVDRGIKNYSTWSIGCSDETEGIGIGGNLANDKPPYGILFIYDDPDNGKAMTFEKTP